MRNPSERCSHYQYLKKRDLEKGLGKVRVLSESVNLQNENPLACSPQTLFHQKVKRERLRWAEMLKRTFKIDVMVCPKCSGRMEQIAVIKDRATAKNILESLGEQSSFRPLEPTEDRGPPAASEFVADDFDQRDPSW